MEAFAEAPALGGSNEDVEEELSSTLAAGSEMTTIALAPSGSEETLEFGCDMRMSDSPFESVTSRKRKSPSDNTFGDTSTTTHDDDDVPAAKRLASERSITENSMAAMKDFSSRELLEAKLKCRISITPTPVKFNRLMRMFETTFESVLMQAVSMDKFKGLFFQARDKGNVYNVFAKLPADVEFGSSAAQSNAEFLFDPGCIGGFLNAVTTQSNLEIYAFNDDPKLLLSATGSSVIEYNMNTIESPSGGMEKPMSTAFYDFLFNVPGATMKNIIKTGSHHSMKPEKLTMTVYGIISASAPGGVDVSRHNLHFEISFPTIMGPLAWLFPPKRDDAHVTDRGNLKKVMSISVAFGIIQSVFKYAPDAPFVLKLHPGSALGIEFVLAEMSSMQSNQERDPQKDGYVRYMIAPLTDDSPLTDAS